MVKSKLISIKILRALGDAIRRATKSTLGGLTRAWVYLKKNNLEAVETHNRMMMAREGFYHEHGYWIRGGLR